MLTMDECLNREVADDSINTVADVYPLTKVVSRESLIITGGVRGVISLFLIGEDGSHHEMDSQIEENDCLWGLALHPQENLLLTSFSEGVVKAWGFSSDETGEVRFHDAEEGLSFNMSSKSPTDLIFSSAESNNFAVGISQESSVWSFDLNSSSAKSKVNYRGGASSQVNQLSSDFFSSGLTAAACEDGFIRVLDFRTNKVVQSWQAHQEAVSSLDLTPDGSTLVSGGHDGFLRLWDLRRGTKLGEKELHSPKMDEVINSVKFFSTENMVVSAGADGRLIFS